MPMINKSIEERMEEFVQYHRDGDGECNAILLKKYSQKHKLNIRDCFNLAFFFSITYCCESGIILFLNRDSILYGKVNCAQLKKDMIFQSDRKYVKMKNRFEKLLLFWEKHLTQYDFSRWFRDGALFLETAVRDVEKWYMFGRFSAFLFLETFATMIDASVSNTTINWIEGDTATSGLLNLFGDDAEASYFDQKGVLTVPVDKMDARLHKVISEVKRTGGDANTTKIETSLCAYRKFYKGTRYNGFYLDRMLEELIWYQENKPQYANLTSELFSMRQQCFPEQMLGEKHGWDGIRKEEKKMYREYGII